jgi:hypothetical protein
MAARMRLRPPDSGGVPPAGGSRGGDLILPIGLLLLAGAWTAVPRLAPWTGDRRGEIHFTFNPPTPATYLETVRRTRISSAGRGALTTEVLQYRTRVTINRSADGFVLTCRFLTATRSRDGRPDVSGLSQALQDQVVIEELDRGGRLVGVRGFDHLMKTLPRALPRPLLDGLSGVVDEEAMIRRERGEWYQRVGRFSGRKARIGDVWAGTDELELASGRTVPHYTFTRFVETVRHQGRECVRIQSWYASNLEAVQRMLGMTMTQVLALASGSNVRVPASDTWIAGEGERLVDPATLLCYRERLHRTAKLEVDLPFFGRTSRLTEEMTETELTGE